MSPRVLLVSVPFADVEQTDVEREYWKSLRVQSASTCAEHSRRSRVFQ